MLVWDKEAEKYSIKCDLGCDTAISVHKKDFTEKQWEAFGPEVDLHEAALQANWEMAYDNERDEILIVCPTCIIRKKAGL